MTPAHGEEAPRHRVWLTAELLSNVNPMVEIALRVVDSTGPGNDPVCNLLRSYALNGSPSNRSRVAISETGLRVSLLTCFTGLPIGSKAAIA